MWPPLPLPNLPPLPLPVSGVPLSASIVLYTLLRCTSVLKFLFLLLFHPHPPLLLFFLSTYSP